MDYSFLEDQLISLVVNATNGRGHYSVIGRATIDDDFLSVESKNEEYRHVLAVKTDNIDSATGKMNHMYAWTVQAHARF